MSAFGKPTVITADQAVDLLPDGDDVHTFRGGGFMVIGCDWRRASIIEALRSAPAIQLAGDVARGMRHGMVIDDGGLLFISTDEQKLAALETKLMAEAAA